MGVSHTYYSAKKERKKKKKKTAQKQSQAVDVGDVYT